MGFADEGHRGVTVDGCKILAAGDIMTSVGDDGPRRHPPESDQVNVDITALARQFSEVARSLQSRSDTDGVLAEVVASAVRLIPGADEASISTVTGRRSITCLHPSGGLPERVDALQAATGQGPCLDAAYDHRTVLVPVMAVDQRWPVFAPQAAALGAASMLSFQLFVEGDSLGALNLYSGHTHAFDGESEQIGLLFASHAAVAFADARQTDHLKQAIATRDLIGQAKGILMERYQLDADQAFGVLTRVSQHTNRKMRAVAEELTTSRNLPGLHAGTSGRAGSPSA